MLIRRQTETEARGDAAGHLDARRRAEGAGREGGVRQRTPPGAVAVEVATVEGFEQQRRFVLAEMAPTVGREPVYFFGPYAQLAQHRAGARSRIAEHAVENLEHTGGAGAVVTARVQRCQRPGGQLRITVVVVARIGEWLTNLLDGALDAQSGRGRRVSAISAMSRGRRKEAVEEVLRPALCHQ